MTTRAQQIEDLFQKEGFVLTWMDPDPRRVFVFEEDGLPYEELFGEPLFKLQAPDGTLSSLHKTLYALRGTSYSLADWVEIQEMPNSRQTMDINVRKRTATHDYGFSSYVFDHALHVSRFRRRTDL